MLGFIVAASRGRIQISKTNEGGKVKTVTDQVFYLLALTFVGFFLMVKLTVRTQREVGIERSAEYSRHTVLQRMYGLPIF